MTRLVAGLTLTLAVMLGAVAILPVILLGRRTYAAEIGSAASCLLNAMTGGPRTATFSAWSAALAERGKRTGRWRVAEVDALPFNGQGHCAEALADHRARGLIGAAGGEGRGA